MLVADPDHIAVTDLALKAYEHALEPKRLVIINGGHSDCCLAEFETASRAAIDWLKGISDERRYDIREETPGRCT